MRSLVMDKKTKIKFGVFVVIIAAIVYFAVRYVPWIIKNFEDPEALREYLLSFGGWGVFVFVTIIAIQVVVMFPGDIFSIAGGFIYGIPVGTLLSYCGIMLGMMMAFTIARLLGYDFIQGFIPADKIEKISKILNSAKGTVGMLIIFLAPFIPKDVLVYVAGLSPIKPLRFFIIFGISRLPGSLMLVSTGAFAYEGNILGIVLIVLLLLAMVGVGLWLYKRHEEKKELEE